MILSTVSNKSLISTISGNISNLLFSNLLRSKASSITLDKWLAELLIMVAYFNTYSLSTNCFILFDMGKIEFNGVLNSCAIEEKNLDFSF